MSRLVNLILLIGCALAAIAASTPVIPPPSPALPAAVVAQINGQIQSDLAAAGISQPVSVAVNGFSPLTVPPSPTTQPAIPAVPTYYVDLAGNDAADGRTIATAWKTPRVIDHAIVLLTGGEKFPVPLNAPLNFSGHVFATLTSNAANPATLEGAAGNAAAAPLGANDIVTSWTTTHDCTLSNLIIDSVDGQGFAGEIRGANETVSNVLLGNLNEGLHFINGCTNLTITGGGQIGAVAGRCLFLLDVANITWTGDPLRHFGPASTQSPIRFSWPGVNGGTITGVNVTQVGSTFPIACWAVHQANAVHFINCTSNGGSFSFDTAGGQDVNDTVTGCTVSGLQTINALLELHPASHKNTITGCTLQYTPQACVAVTGSTGDTITGCTMTSPMGGVQFFAPSSTVVKGCALNTQGHVATMIVNGAAANDGGANTIKAGAQ